MRYALSLLVCFPTPLMNSCALFLDPECGGDLSTNLAALEDALFDNVMDDHVGCSLTLTDNESLMGWPCDPAATELPVDVFTCLGKRRDPPTPPPSPCCKKQATSALSKISMETHATFLEEVCERTVEAPRQYVTPRQMSDVNLAFEVFF